MKETNETNGRDQVNPLLVITYLKEKVYFPRDMDYHKTLLL